MPSSERICTTHVGSLPRPEGVAEAVSARETGEAEVARARLASLVEGAEIAGAKLWAEAA